MNPNWEFSGSKTRTGYSNTNSLQAEIERRYSSGMAFQLFYTFTRSLTTSDAGGYTSGGAAANANDTSGQGPIPENIHFFGEPNLSYDERLRVLYHNSTAIPEHRVRYNGIFDLPFGKGKAWGRDLSGPLNHILGGWQVATIGDWRGGLWSSVNSAVFLNGDPTLKPGRAAGNDICWRSAEVMVPGRLQSYFGHQCLTGSASEAGSRGSMPNAGFGHSEPTSIISLPIVLANGTTRLTPIANITNSNARAFYTGAGAWNVDFSLFKNFTISESMNVRFTADFFNVFNHPLDNAPNTYYWPAGLSTQPNEPRIIQFSLRFDF